MCGADHGPHHDDPAAAEVCDLYHTLDRSELPRINSTLGDRERELLWQIAVGVGPDGLARRLGSAPHDVRSDLVVLARRLVDLGARSS